MALRPDEPAPEDETPAPNETTMRALVPIGYGAITDGSQVLRHDGYDVQEFRYAQLAFPRFAAAITAAEERVKTAPALMRDLFWSLYKRAPQLAPVVPLTPAFQMNQEILTQILSTVEWHDLRAAGTVGDVFGSALATLGVTQRALGALDAATTDRANRLHELETGIDDLLKEAETLEEFADQLQGDRAAGLFTRAVVARRQAEEQRQAAEQLAAELAAGQDEREDAVRRAARAGLRASTEELDEANAAITAFGGAGWGLRRGGPAQMGTPALNTQAKLALAQSVQHSQRLKQIAQLCGRMRRTAFDVQRSKVSHSPEEITSITRGADLAHLLPSEFALLTDSTLEDLFYLKLAEQQLNQYELIGNERQGQGPVILALDSSGSMSLSLDGAVTKEVWSKAVMLAVLAIATKQGRECAVIQFGTAIRMWRFPTGPIDPQTLVECSDLFMNASDEDYPLWMDAALALVDEAPFNRADVICIADGLSTIDAATRAHWQARRNERGMRVFSVLIGTRQGEGVLASISDALMTLDDLNDAEVLNQIFSI